MLPLPSVARSLADTRMFVDRCSEKIQPFSLNSRALCSYIDYLQPKAAYSSIRRRISSLRRLNRLLGFKEQTQTKDVYLAIQRLKQSKCLEQQQAMGLNFDMLFEIIDAQPETLTGTRN